MGKLLIVVDMVKGFAEKGALADPKIKEIVPAIKEYAKDPLTDCWSVRDAHDKDDVEFKDFPSHCLAGSEEAELIDELKDIEFEKDYTKNSTNTFFANWFRKDIENKIRNLAVDEIIITGCCTDICVLSLALTLKTYCNHLGHSITIRVPKNAVATYNIPGVHDAEEYNKKALDLMELQGIICE